MTDSVVATVTTTFAPWPNDLSAVGYFSSAAGVVGTVSCSASYAFTIKSSSGICCHTASKDDCLWNNRCSGSMVIWEDGSSSTCLNNNLCRTTTLFAQERSADWTAKMAWCMVDGIPNTLYRTFTGTQLTLVPADSFTTTLDPEPTTTTTRSPIPTSTETTLTTTASTTSIDPSDLGAQRTDEAQPDDDGGSNVGAIAGGVVGGVAGLALIILAVWFVLRRQKKKNAEMREIGVGYTAPEPK